ncbi:MAG: hypothetical protein BMS9Abin12_0702 [Acidimicrobiia bacterium]|nr:MAG: hypothetical protein BMS9Abin12_0702 [Acidimicrobiia bacterium]
MLPIRMVETEREDFDGTIIEMWREDEFIGMVFWDGEAPIVQIYPDSDGDVQDLDVREIQQLLDTALQIIDPNAFDDEFTSLREAVADMADEPSDVHPATAKLLGEFDDRAVYRTEDGEGFFKRGDAEAFIEKCEELDLGVVEMEGFDLEGVKLIPRPKLDLVVTPQKMMSWSEFRTYANATAADTLRIWPSRGSLVVAFVIQQPDTETIVA